MFKEITKDNWLLFAQHHYDKPILNSEQEFYDDLKRFKYLKRLFRKYRITGNIKVRLAVNHIIVLQNVFGVEAAITLLLFKVDKSYWGALKTILDYLGYLYPHELDSIKVDKNIDELFNILEPEDLLKFGLIPEFVGRVPIIATLEDLNEESLVKILTEPKNALIKQYQRMFEIENVKLTFSDESLISIAKQAIERKTGARGLRSILESILLETMFDLPELQSVEEVVISNEVIEGKSRPLYIYSDHKEDIGNSA